MTKKQITANSENHKMYAGLDVHKESVQIAVVDDAGRLLFNKKISSRFSSITKITAGLPDGSGRF